MLGVASARGGRFGHGLWLGPKEQNLTHWVGREPEPEPDVLNWRLSMVEMGTLVGWRREKCDLDSFGDYAVYQINRMVVTKYLERTTEKLDVVFAPG